MRKGLMDIIVESLNEDEEQSGRGGKWTSLHSEPVELVKTPAGVRHRDIRTGKFLADADLPEGD